MSFLDSAQGRDAIEAGDLTPLGTEVDPDSLPSGWRRAVTIDPISPAILPSEWSFEMRRAAARTTLRVTRAALEAGFEAKDATAFNILFDGTRPVFIDLGSFRRGYSGHWPAYGQFGDHFMNPLLIEAHTGIPSQALHPSVHGIAIDTARRMVRLTDVTKRGVWPWIIRRAAAERLANRPDTATRERIATATLPKGAVRRVLSNAEQVIEGLTSSARSEWGDYVDAELPYAPGQVSAKRRFVGESLDHANARSVLDVGTNTGSFAELAATRDRKVIAIDGESRVIDDLYVRLRTSPHAGRIFPAVVDVASPTPPLGWRGTERPSFLDRVTPVDASLWLAVVHHLLIGAGIPLGHVVDLIRAAGSFAVVEYVDPEDPNVHRMTAGRRWGTVPPTEAFLAELDARSMRVVRREAVTPTRTLFFVACA